MRRRRRHDTWINAPYTVDSVAPVQDPSTGLEQKLVRTEMNDCIGEYIARLPASYRSVVVLSEHEGLTNQEIADALGVSVATVRLDSIGLALA